jgi:predicted RNase H-like HicB family nuclease
MKKRYAIAIEKGERNYSAYVLDVDGCISTGQTLEETRRNIAEALAFHFEGMTADGDPIPEPATAVDYVEVEVPTPVAAG